MPKMKTNRAAAKRLRTSGAGRVRRSRAGHNHLMRGKPARRLRKLRKNTMASSADERQVKRLLPYAF